VEKAELRGYVCASTITTINYLASKAVGARQAKQHIRGLLALLEVAPVNRAVIEGAFEASFSDFEDAVSHEAARQVNAEAIVTRNLRHFRKSSIPVYSPEGILTLLESQGHE
jgi:hypothetical protein